MDLGDETEGVELVDKATEEAADLVPDFCGLD
jgi:hypothetical protein